jgi:hypothetical protein
VNLLNQLMQLCAGESRSCATLEQQTAEEMVRGTIVWVVMQNDFPQGVFTDKTIGDEYVKTHNKPDDGIFVRSYPFNLRVHVGDNG